MTNALSNQVDQGMRFGQGTRARTRNLAKDRLWDILGPSASALRDANVVDKTPAQVAHYCPCPAIAAGYVGLSSIARHAVPVSRNAVFLP